MKVLVTGSTGFVGSHLCERLIERGHEVYAQARNREKFDFFRIPGKLVLGKLHHDRPLPWLGELPDDLTAVIHTAGLVHSFEEKNFFQTNAKGTGQLVSHLAQRYDNLKFILISSLAAMGPSENLLSRREEHRPHPVSAYGRSKLASEELLNKNAPVGWKKFILRPPIIIGPRDTAFLEFFRIVKKGFVPLPGTNAGKKQYSYIGIYDLIEVICKVLEYPNLEDDLFLVSHPECITAEKLLKTIASQMGKRRPLLLPVPLSLVKCAASILKKVHRFHHLDVRLTPDKCFELAPNAWTCSSEKSQKAIGAKYNWTLEDSLEAAFEDYQRRGQL